MKEVEKLTEMIAQKFVIFEFGIVECIFTKDDTRVG